MKVLVELVLDNFFYANEQNCQVFFRTNNRVALEENGLRRFTP